MANLSENQEKIIEAFLMLARENPNEKITVQMIADRADLHRSTIYKYHFSNIEDIIRHIRQILDKELVESFHQVLEKDITDDSALLDFIANTLLPSLYHRRTWLKVLYTTDVDPTFERYLLKSYSPLVEDYLNKLEKETVIGSHFAAQVVVREMLALISTWLTDDEPEPLSLFKKKFLTVFKMSPFDFLTIEH